MENDESRRRKKEEGAGYRDYYYPLHRRLSGRIGWSVGWYKEETNTSLEEEEEEPAQLSSSIKQAAQPVF